MKPWVPRMIVVAAGLVIGLTGQAQAVSIGDQFTVTFTETVPTAGLVATADITLGASVGGSLFSIANISAISGDVCLTCGLTSQNLTGALFNGSTSSLTGQITGTFLGTGGATHAFVLALVDVGGLNWAFTDIQRPEGLVETAQGTYSTAAASVPEPSTVLLLGSALTALAAWRRRIKA